MKGKFFAIEEAKAFELIERTGKMMPANRGIDRRCFIVGEYAVLSTSRLKLRNVDVRDDKLSHLNDIIEKLLLLEREGVNVVPILGYCYDPDSMDGEGFLIELRARGAEMYDDAMICKFEAWTQDNDEVYLKSDADCAEYITNRTRELALAPQAHYDKFIADMLEIMKRDILIDFMGKSNFFYDREAGFQFIDLDTHTDSHYGLCEDTISNKEVAAIGGFAPCHFAEGTSAFAPIALVPSALAELGEVRLAALAESNSLIFEKCLAALKANGVSDAVLDKTLQRLKVFDRRCC